MNHFFALHQGSTKNLITLYDRIEGLLLAALTKGDRAENFRQRTTHREKSAAFLEELTSVHDELVERARNGDRMAREFVSRINVGFAYHLAS